jgi:ankyrin repeat protein
LETQNQLVVYLGQDVLSESAGASHDVSHGNPGKDCDDFDDEDNDDAQSGATSNVRSGVSSRNTNTRRFWKRNSKKWSRALITAAANDDLNLMKQRLRKSADIEYRSKDGIPSHEGMAATHVAAEGNKVAALRFFIEQEVNVNSLIKVSEETPLHPTARGGFSTATRDLIRSGANLDVQDQYHQTPLLVANEEEKRCFFSRSAQITDCIM